MSIDLAVRTPCEELSEKIRALIDGEIEKILKKYPEMLIRPGDVTHRMQRFKIGELEYVQRHTFEFDHELIAGFEVNVKYATASVTICKTSYEK